MKKVPELVALGVGATVLALTGLIAWRSVQAQPDDAVVQAPGPVDAPSALTSTP